MKNKFKIKESEAGERLDKFLAANINKLSRSKIQKLIKENMVRVNGEKENAHYLLGSGDLIEIISLKLKSKKTEKIKAVRMPKLKIISDTPEYLVIDKPAGLIAHGAEHIKEKTLVDLILKKYPKIARVGEDKNRPGIVHRLDKDASGLMVIAKTRASFKNLKKQFQERKVGKKYSALVHGQIKKDEGEINFPIERSSQGHKMAAMPFTNKGENNEEGREAITFFHVEKRFINYTFLEAVIKTGRTHQIRAHLAAYGHPLVGDDLYGTNKNRLQNKKLNLNRIFLVARELSFKDLSGGKQTFKIELPSELKNLLDIVK
jgi:23S rRNA pseudouridine1911/1915/1917 synthase